MRELNNIKIIAVDHGYGNIKTASTVTPIEVTAMKWSRSSDRHLKWHYKHSVG